jgi:hypothetical protein
MFAAAWWRSQRRNEILLWRLDVAMAPFCRVDCDRFWSSRKRLREVCEVQSQEKEHFKKSFMLFPASSCN